MRVFVTGATGFIGTAVVKELLAAGHSVLGLARSETGAAALSAAGAEPLHGTLEDLDSLRRGVERADGVIHLAFIHDFSQFVANCETDRRAIIAMGEAIEGSSRPMLVTSGTGIARGAPGQPATEDAPPLQSAQMPRAASEEAALAAAEKGSIVAIVRLPQVHDPRRQGLVSYAIGLALRTGVYAYVGDGSNRWPAAHISDVARLYRLALETPEAGARYHAVAEEGVSMRAIAEVVAPRLGLPIVSLTPEQATEHFGWLGHFAADDLIASSAWTRAQLGWEPVGPTLLEDLARLDISDIDRVLV